MNNKQIKVGIFMGSKSDLPIVNEAAKILDSFSIPNEINILSAHRSPHAVVKTLEKLEKQGAKLFIASAGMAPHLAGVIAAHTHKPVLGIPLGGGDLSGIDSLLSTVQMPKGIPVATFAIGKSGAINAALFAVQILSQNDQSLSKQFDEYRTAQTAEVIQINEEK